MYLYKSTVQRLQELPLNMMLPTHPFMTPSIPSTTILKGKETINTYFEEILESIDIMQQAAVGVAPGWNKKPFRESYDEFVAKLPKEWGVLTIAELNKVPFYGAITFLNMMKKITGG